MGKFGYLIIGVIICFVILTLVGKGMVLGYQAGQGDNSPAKMPTLQDLMKKGYTEEEAKLIMNSDSYKKGELNF